jgi:hypothetical protein
MDFGETASQLTLWRSVRRRSVYTTQSVMHYPSALCALLYQIFARVAEVRLNAPVCRAGVFFEGRRRSKILPRALRFN